MQLQVPVFTVRFPTQLSVSVSRKLLVTEHSDMGNMPILAPLYDDACDVGFALHNALTGVTTRWHMIEEKRDADGDLLVTVFGPCSETVRLTPVLEGWKLHVLND